MKQKRRTTNLLAVALLLLMALLLLAMPQVTGVSLARPDPGVTPMANVGNCCSCTCYAHDRRPDLRDVCKRDAKFWAQDANSAGYATGEDPQKGAIVVFQPGVEGADWGRDCQEWGGPDYCYGHVAYVEDVYSSSEYGISEKGWYGGGWDPCIVHPRNAHTGGGVDFIYKVAQAGDLNLSPPNPKVGQEVSFCFDVRNYSYESITFQNIGPQGHGPPNCQGGLWHKFAQNITIPGGQTVRVCASESFEWEGTWCVEHIPTQDQDGDWSDLPANNYRQAQPFDVGPPDTPTATPTPLPGPGVTIDRAYTTDTAGTPKTVFNAGERIGLRFDVTNPGPSFRLNVRGWEVTYDGWCVLNKEEPWDLPSGQSTHVWVPTLPSNAQSGSYEFFGYICSGYLVG